MKTVFIQTYGCQMNEYDSHRLLDLLKATHGLEKVNVPEEADVILLNTCSIRERAEEKVFSELGRFRSLKEKKPEVIIGVGGCVASQEGEAIQKRAPFVDLVFGPQTLQRLPNMLSELTQTKSPLVDISFPTIEKFDQLPNPSATGVKAYVSIMEGCSKYCTYCVVPYTRGEEMSRSLDEVIHEVLVLTAQGVREVTLLGQNVNAYRGKMQNGETADLALLIHYLAEIESLSRIRFMTSHPVEFNERLIETYKNVPKLANHLHLPVQSGSDRILSLMKRGHTAKEYLNKIEALKNIRPNMSITSDFIVGFPTESEEDFQATLDIVEKVGFDHSYSFIYSKRPGTPASNIPDDLSLSCKKERLQRLQKALTNEMLKVGERMIGTHEWVLVEGPSKKDPNILTGRTGSSRVVNFGGSLEQNRNNLIGELVEVEITAVNMHILTGEMVNI